MDSVEARLKKAKEEVRRLEAQIEVKKIAEDGVNSITINAGKVDKERKRFDFDNINDAILFLEGLRNALNQVPQARHEPRSWPENIPLQERTGITY